jgi:hypothetical protein
MQPVEDRVRARGFLWGPGYQRRPERRWRCARAVRCVPNAWRPAEGPQGAFGAGVGPGRTRSTTRCTPSLTSASGSRPMRNGPATISGSGSDGANAKRPPILRPGATCSTPESVSRSPVNADDRSRGVEAGGLPTRTGYAPVDVHDVLASLWHWWVPLSGHVALH